MVERRRFPRVCFECPVQLREMRGVGHNLVKNSFSKNVSQVGVEIISFDFYPINDRVQVNLFSQGCANLVQAIGRVVWVQQLPNQEKYRIGIELVEVSRSAYKKLKTMINKSVLRHLFSVKGDMDD